MAMLSNILINRPYLIARNAYPLSMTIPSEKNVSLVIWGRKCNPLLFIFSQMYVNLYYRIESIFENN